MEFLALSRILVVDNLYTSDSFISSGGKYILLSKQPVELYALLWNLNLFWDIT